MIFFTFWYFIYECYVISSDIRHVVGLKTKPVQPPHNLPPSPPVLAATRSPTRTRVAVRVSVYAGDEKKWTHMYVTLETSSNQQVDPSGLPRIWWNRKPYFLWVSTILANHSKVGGSTEQRHWSSPNTERPKKKSRHSANPSDGGGPGRDKAGSEDGRNAGKLTSWINSRQSDKKL